MFSREPVGRLVEQVRTEMAQNGGRENVGSDTRHDRESAAAGMMQGMGIGGGIVMADTRQGHQLVAEAQRPLASRKAFHGIIEQGFGRAGKSSTEAGASAPSHRKQVQSRHLCSR